VRGSRLRDKDALITGGGSGIGAATARPFCQEGAAVLLVDADAGALARTSASILEQVLEARIAHCVADVADAGQATGAVEQASFAFSRLDVRVNDVAMRNYSGLADATPEEWLAAAAPPCGRCATQARPASPTCRRATRSPAAPGWGFTTPPRPACWP
jgi:meso-butanediol dehydrogenase/(S,S)-butanediol dehydrogenase/diacetyl reductase